MMSQFHPQTNKRSQQPWIEHDVCSVDHALGGGDSHDRQTDEQGGERVQEPACERGESLLERPLSLRCVAERLLDVDPQVEHQGEPERKMRLSIQSPGGEDEHRVEQEQGAVAPLLAVASTVLDAAGAQHDESCTGQRQQQGVEAQRRHPSEIDQFDDALGADRAGVCRV